MGNNLGARRHLHTLGSFFLVWMTSFSISVEGCAVFQAGNIFRHTAVQCPRSTLPSTRASLYRFGANRRCNIPDAKKTKKHQGLPKSVCPLPQHATQPAVDHTTSCAAGAHHFKRYLHVNSRTSCTRCSFRFGCPSHAGVQYLLVLGIERRLRPSLPLLQAFEVGPSPLQ